MAPLKLKISLSSTASGELMETTPVATKTREAPIDRRLVFTSKATEDLIHQFMDVVTLTKRGMVACLLCGFVAASRSRHCIHLRQHFTNFVCMCGESTYNRDRLLGHARKNDTFGELPCTRGTLYEVDADSFAEFKKVTRNNLKKFPPTRPAVRDEKPITTDEALQKGKRLLLAKQWEDAIRAAKIRTTSSTATTTPPERSTSQKASSRPHDRGEPGTDNQPGPSTSTSGERKRKSADDRHRTDLRSKINRVYEAPRSVSAKRPPSSAACSSYAAVTASCFQPVGP